jgi:hypothetical protein
MCSTRGIAGIVNVAFHARLRVRLRLGQYVSAPWNTVHQPGQCDIINSDRDNIEVNVRFWYGRERLTVVKSKQARKHAKIFKLKPTSFRRAS